MLLAPSVKVVTRLRTSPLISRDDKPNVRSKSGKLKNIYRLLSGSYSWLHILTHCTKQDPQNETDIFSYSEV